MSPRHALRHLSAAVIAAACTLAQDATPVASLKIASGFRAELLYTVPKDQKGSWVAMCSDPKGRLIVSDQYGKLYRLTPPPLGSGEGLKVENIDVELGCAQGLLCAFDSLYVMVNEEKYQGRGLYRVRDTDGDDRYDSVELLRKLDGGGEHGPHAILLSPDKKTLTLVIGNQTRVTETTSTHMRPLWGEDHLIPRLWDGNGFMKGVLAPGGWIARTDPDGKQWDLVATGFRNEYDAAYNREGELFTYDADMEWDMNTPWYRPTRVNHVVSGGEYGWRSGAGKWPAYYADSMGSITDIGPGSPTGVTFGYGAKFPAKYQDALFINDWSYGKLYAVHMKPDGASYTATAEEFISGSPLPLTDIVVHNDGALYFAIGGRRTQSALYRVTYTGKESTAPVVPNKRRNVALAERHALEALHGTLVANPSGATLDRIWSGLGSKDRAIRFAARVALEWQAPAAWTDRALAETNPDATIQSLIALARVSGMDAQHRKATDPAPDAALQKRILASLGRLQWDRLDERQHLDLVRAHAVALTRLGRPDEETIRTLTAKFDPLFPASTRQLNAELAPMLVYLQAPSAAAKLSAALATAPSQEEQLDLARAMRVLKSGWTLDQRRAYFGWFLKAANFRGGASLSGFLRDIKADSVATLSDSEKTALADILGAQPPKRNVLENLLVGRKLVKEWTVADFDPVLSKGLNGGRDLNRGRTLFGAVGCFNCHRYATEGGAVGPDLTGVAGRFSPHDLLESVIEPSKEISDQYGQVVITKKDGDTVIGRVANLNGDSIAMMTDMFDPNGFNNVKRQDIVSIEKSKVAPMPEGLLNTLTQDEVLDLLAYLLSRGQGATAKR
jgi:putative heme-binding domain-containing protein